MRLASALGGWLVGESTETDIELLTGSCAAQLINRGQQITVPRKRGAIVRPHPGPAPHSGTAGQRRFAAEGLSAVEGRAGKIDQHSGTDAVASWLCLFQVVLLVGHALALVPDSGRSGRVSEVQLAAGNQFGSDDPGRLGSTTVTLKVWLRADDYDFDLLARMFAVGDTRFLREGARCYLTNSDLDEAAKSGEVPHEQAKSLLSKINGYAIVHDSTYYPIELDYRYTMPGEDEPTTPREPGQIRILRYLDPERPMPRVAPVGFDLTDTDVAVTDVLMLLDRPRRGARWVELYKVFEIIEDDGSLPAVRDAVGVSKAAIERFTRTANHDRASGADARHARVKTEPPAKPMSLPEAHDIMCSLAREWIQLRAERTVKEEI
jgi:hypothetical protein